MDNKREVQEYLTALRARLTPEAAGLTVFGGERRVPGLRREEVAQVAGISTAYYTRMERGDLSGVSESVLYALVRALQLNEAETTHLFDLAHAASGPRPRLRSKATPKISERLARMLETMRDVPAISLTRPVPTFVPRGSARVEPRPVSLPRPPLAGVLPRLGDQRP